MSNATFGHANHTLTLLGQQALETEHFTVLHSGYLTDLAQAIKRGTIPSRHDFRKSIGLPPLEFEVWKEIEIGGVTAEELITSMEEAGGNYVGDEAKFMMRKSGEFKTLPAKKKIRLARCKVRDLGFTAMPTTEELWAKVVEFSGPDLSPAEVGPQLRRQWTDQEKGDAVWVVMKQITDSCGFPGVFCIERNSDGWRYLSGLWAFPKVQWFLDLEIVFPLR